VTEAEFRAKEIEFISFTTVQDQMALYNDKREFIYLPRPKNVDIKLLDFAGMVTFHDARRDTE